MFCLNLAKLHKLQTIVPRIHVQVYSLCNLLILQHGILSCLNILIACRLKSIHYDVLTRMYCIKKGETITLQLNLEESN